MKYQVDRSIERYNAQLVVKRYTYGVDYLETFIIMPKISTIKILLSFLSNYT